MRDTYKEDAENFEKKISVKVKNDYKTILHADLDEFREDNENCVRRKFLNTSRN